VDNGVLARITRVIAHKFPEMAGARPSVRQHGSSGRGAPQYLLVYKARASLPGGRAISRIVRVVAEADGRIVQITTSR
jgi:hypothetical protein